MSTVSGHSLAKYYGAQEVFAAIDLDIARDDKIGLVGPNGAGKTTLLRIILGHDEPSEGEVHRARRLRVGYLPQNPEFPSEQTLYREMLTVFDDLCRQERALLAMAEEMSRASDTQELVERYARAEQRFELAGGYEYENRIRRVLGGLGFANEAHDWPISILSGGQITRALLAKLLLQEPQLLVLDEPTNYLDLAALEWVESYLQEWSHGLLVASHDRYFLDRVVSRIWELDHGSLETYRGNYSHYVQQREHRRLTRERAYEKQQAFIAKTEDFIRRYKAGQRSKQAQGRETRLARMERLERPQENRQINLSLASGGRSGNDVLMSEGIRIGYRAKPGAGEAQDADQGEYLLFETGELLVQRGQAVALLGANGCGKTTFLRTILGEVEPLAGRIRLGASLQVSYLPQTQEWLDEDRTVLEHITDTDRLSVAEARNFLARFLFTGDEVHKLSTDLSGGERSRLALALLTLEGANLLLLDEPTTHLDVGSQEILQDVLTGFEGTILFVTHDRYLINALATDVWVVEDGRLRQFEGNYSDYLQALEQEREEAADHGDGQGPTAEEVRRRQQRQERRAARRHQEHIEHLEAEIAHLETELETLPALIDRASAAQDLERVQALGQEYQELHEVLSERLHEWESCVTMVRGGEVR